MALREHERVAFYSVIPALYLVIKLENAASFAAQKNQVVACVFVCSVVIARVVARVLALLVIAEQPVVVARSNVVAGIVVTRGKEVTALTNTPFLYLNLFFT